MVKSMKAVKFRVVSIKNFRWIGIYVFRTFTIPPIYDFLPKNIACSKRSDSGEQCEVKNLSPSLAFIFFALLFTSHRSPLSESLEQATKNIDGRTLVKYMANSFTRSITLFAFWRRFNIHFPKALVGWRNIVDEFGTENLLAYFQWWFWMKAHIRH